MSGLPPLNAATTFAPETRFGLFGSLSSGVKAVTCEVSSPIMPIRNASAAFAARVTPSTIDGSSFARKFIQRFGRRFRSRPIFLAPLRLGDLALVSALRIRQGLIDKPSPGARQVTRGDAAVLVV